MPNSFPNYCDCCGQLTCHTATPKGKEYLLCCACYSASEIIIKEGAKAFTEHCVFDLKDRPRTEWSWQTSSDYPTYSLLRWASELTWQKRQADAEIVHGKKF